MEKEQQNLNPRFEKNISALASVNLKLAGQIFEIQTNKRYEIFQGKDPIDINFLDKKTNSFIYVSPKENIENFIQEEQVKIKLPFRYFFGIANGIVLHALLAKPHIKRIVVIEPSLELIYITFHLMDYSSFILEKKLQIEYNENLDFTNAYSILNHSEGKTYAKFFELESLTQYYHNIFFTEYKKATKILTDAFYSLIAGHGNCAIDSLMGLSHHVKNLPKMVTGPKISTLSNKKNTDTAIVVSTGPSLSKQLPLLKQIQDYVTIICVDASFPILEKHGIKPDFVTVLERIPETGKFFRETQKEFQEDVTFILVSIVHEDIIHAIRGGKIVLQMRPHAYTKHFGLDEFGYIGTGMSAANLAHELGYFLGVSNIILIGQDLAFGENKTSHAEGHLYGENEEKTEGHEHYIEKYGGGGVVQTTHYWILFRNYFERTIAFAKQHNLAKTINATEGGARIPGTVEMTFQEVIDTIIDTSSKKELIVTEVPTVTEQKKYINQFIEILNDWIQDSIKKQEQVEETFMEIQEFSEKLIEKKDANQLDSITLEQLIPYLNKIDSIKAFFTDKTFSDRYLEVVQTYILHMELELVAIPMIEAKTEEENINKIVEWIMQHRYWLFSLAGGLQAIRDTILQATKTWDSNLKNRLVAPIKKEIPIDEKKYQALKKKVEEKNNSFIVQIT